MDNEFGRAGYHGLLRLESPQHRPGKEGKRMEGKLVFWTTLLMGLGTAGWILWTAVVSLLPYYQRLSAALTLIR